MSRIKAWITGFWRDIRRASTLPHGRSFLLVNQIVAIVEDPPQIRVGGTFTGNERPWAKDHFPGDVMMAAGWQIEAVGQALLYLRDLIPGYEDAHFAFVGLDQTEFIRMIRPDQSYYIDIWLRWWKPKQRGRLAGIGEAAFTIMLKGDSNPKPACRGIASFIAVRPE